MTITKYQNEDTTTISVEGRLNAQNAEEFGSEVKKMVESSSNLVFDFDKVEYISSSGLRVLLYAQKEMNKRGTMKIINVNEDVYDVMKAAGFTGISEIYTKE